MCKYHGAYAPAMIAKADRAAERFSQGWHPPTEARPSDFERLVRLQRYEEAKARYNAHVFRKTARKYGWDVEAMLREQKRFAEHANAQNARAIALRDAARAPRLDAPKPLAGEPIPWDVFDDWDL
ncbi:MAG: hypothetical protein JWR52_3493 [Marmoricola sp.]|nr:hypothetical protein [Marmoricola sp.]